MRKEQCYLSTIDPQAHTLAAAHGLGLEIAEFCTAWNMDRELPATDRLVREKIAAVPRRLLHGPFNELFPCAIDPKARELAAFRYRQALNLAREYGGEKVILHGGFHPRSYYPQWYIQESIAFWREFLVQEPPVTIVLENVMEEEAGWLVEIVRAVDHPKLRLCLDVGHVNAYSREPVMAWLTQWAPWLDHFHIHNNDGSWDTHDAPGRGTIPMVSLLTRAGELCPQASFTLELPNAQAGIQWMEEQALWN